LGGYIPSTVFLDFVYLIWISKLRLKMKLD
jgi:hypothetical protein